MCSRRTPFIRIFFYPPKSPKIFLTDYPYMSSFKFEGITILNNTSLWLDFVHFFLHILVHYFQDASGKLIGELQQFYCVICLATLLTE